MQKPPKNDRKPLAKEEVGKGTGNLVAIVGRPNVGKSSLFNRILAKRIAIVEKLSGTTRDRLGQKTQWNGVPFELLDTGGIITDAEEELDRMVGFQVDIAISEASVVLFVVDVSQGITPLDLEVAEILRKAGQKKVIIVVNKCDNPARLEAASEFYNMGFEKVFGLSAMHGLGIGALLDEVVAELPDEAPSETEEAIKIAVVGQPNVGKSTFINLFVGEERLLVHDSPGTTRDSVDVPYETQDGQKILFIDTAGIRRKRSMSRPIEKLSSLRAERSVAGCDVALLMIDAANGPTTGDSRIAHVIRQRQRSCVIVVNKWDLMKGVRRDSYIRIVRDKLPFLSYCPVVFTSFITGKEVLRVLATATDVYHESQRRIPTPALNSLLQAALQHRLPPLVRSARGGSRSPRSGRSPSGSSTRGRRLKVYYATQTGVSPPKVRLFVNSASLCPANYLRYLTNRIRDSFPFPGSPILLDLRNRT